MNKVGIIIVFVVAFLILSAVLLINLFYYQDRKNNPRNDFVLNQLAEIPDTESEIDEQDQETIPPAVEKEDQTNGIESQPRQDDIKITQIAVQPKKPVEKRGEASPNRKVMLKNYQYGQKKKGPSQKNNYSQMNHLLLENQLLKQDFSSWGDYVSIAEKKYRQSIIKQLVIKTIIIDHLSDHNGISQEFFKIVYQSEMIPPRILEQIVESREFRKTIPPQYLKQEKALHAIQNGYYVRFSHKVIQNLLVLWSEGKLTPIQKAWKVGAVK